MAEQFARRGLVAAYGLIGSATGSSSWNGTRPEIAIDAGAGGEEKFADLVIHRRLEQMRGPFDVDPCIICPAARWTAARRHRRQVQDGDRFDPPDQLIDFRPVDDVDLFDVDRFAADGAKIRLLPGAIVEVAEIVTPMTR